LRCERAQPKKPFPHRRQCSGDAAATGGTPALSRRRRSPRPRRPQRRLSGYTGAASRGFCFSAIFSFGRPLPVAAAQGLLPVRERVHSAEAEAAGIHHRRRARQGPLARAPRRRLG